MRKALFAATLAAALLTGCATAAPPSDTPAREAVTLLDSEQLTITTTGLQTVLQDHTSGTETTYTKALRLKQSGTAAEPAAAYTARQSYQSEAVTVYIRGAVLVIVTENQTFII